MPIPQTRRHRVDPGAPEAAGICDRCGFMYSLNDMPFQFDYRGYTLQSLGIRVCPRCYDDPQHQLRVKIVPADPVPVKNPRPPKWRQDVQDGPIPVNVVTQDGYVIKCNGVIGTWIAVQ